MSDKKYQVIAECSIDHNSGDMLVSVSDSVSDMDLLNHLLWDRLARVTDEMSEEIREQVKECKFWELRKASKLKEKESYIREIYARARDNLNRIIESRS